MWISWHLLQDKTADRSCFGCRCGKIAVVGESSLTGSRRGVYGGVFDVASLTASGAGRNRKQVSLGRLSHERGETLTVDEAKTGACCFGGGGFQGIGDGEGLEYAESWPGAGMGGLEKRLTKVEWRREGGVWTGNQWIALKNGQLQRRSYCGGVGEAFFFCGGALRSQGRGARVSDVTETHARATRRERRGKTVPAFKGKRWREEWLLFLRQLQLQQVSRTIQGKKKKKKRQRPSNWNGRKGGK